MISIINKENCSGCSACASRCPKQCISMKSDKEGFLYPFVDQSSCVDCGICDKVCHELHPFDERKPIQVFGSFNSDLQVRLESSSGGIFLNLAQQILNQGGIVFGAKFDDNWQVLLDYANSISELKAFVGSKYVQARVGTAFVDCERFLKQGRIVMFSGTPCQIAGLKHYLKKEYQNLFTLDLACHGAPSPLAWNRYLLDFLDLTDKIISNFSLYNRAYWKWRKYNVLINVQGNYIDFLSSNQVNPYLISMKENLILRPSCHFCKAGNGRSSSDVTLADFWGISQFKNIDDESRGYSLVSVNSGKGMALVSKGRFEKFNICYADVIKNFKTGCKPHIDRDCFLESIQMGLSLPDSFQRIKKSNIQTTANHILTQLKGLIKGWLIEYQLFKHNRVELKKLNIGRNKNLKLVSISFRDKTFGWNKYSLRLKCKTNYENRNSNTTIAK